MISNRKVIVVLPAFNASKTLTKTYQEIPFDIVDETILVDGFSSDGTPTLAQNLGIPHVMKHSSTTGYSGNVLTPAENANIKK